MQSCCLLPPPIGLGTFKLIGDDALNPVRAALRHGLRHIDTATVYKNEIAIGQAVREAIEEGFLVREDVYITSKVSPYEQGTVAATAACEALLERLNLGYVDLVLIHWPGASRTPLQSPLNATLRLETWRVMESFYKRGLFRALGVSNFEECHLEQLLETAVVPPITNQIEAHPRWPQENLRKYCNQHNIKVTAYASFGTGALLNETEAPEVAAVARRTGKTAAQVLLCWGLQKGMCVIPKSSNEERIKEFCSDASGMLPGPDGRYLTQEDEVLLDSMAQPPTGWQKKYCWDPSGVL